MLYTLHRDEVPFVSNGLVNLGGDDALRQPEPIVVKGMGFGGISRKIQVWGSRCLEFVGVGKKSTAQKKAKANRHSVTATSKKSTVHDDPGHRNSH